MLTLLTLFFALQSGKARSGDGAVHEDQFGFAISATPEDRREPEPGQLTAQIWIRTEAPGAGTGW